MTRTPRRSLLGEAVALWGDRPGAEPAVVAAVAPAVATRLAQVSIEAVADLAEAELALGRAEAAAARLTALLAEQPVHERAAALLMDALAAQGRQAEALAVYERVRETLADALGADPGAALRERHLRLLRAERPTPAADAARPGRPSNLPAPLTSFIGRDDDLARIGTLLATGRLVTVLGPGGAGKTRLALEAARRHRHEYRDGAWLDRPRPGHRAGQDRRGACSPGSGCAAARCSTPGRRGRGRRAGRPRRASSAAGRACCWSTTAST